MILFLVTCRNFMAFTLLLILVHSSTTSKQDITMSIPLITVNELSPSAKLTRARNLKQLKLNSRVSYLPLSPMSNSYSISLSLGTPPQALPFILDIGSSFVWSPCGSNYQCFNCSIPNNHYAQTITFNPNISSSSEIVKCSDRKCWWVVSETQSRCPKCDAKSLRTCSQPCPYYEHIYMKGSTTGQLLFETLNFPNQTIHKFLYGCASSSTHVPIGVVGFGRGLASLPSQVGVKKFSYCFPNNQFDQPYINEIVWNSSSYNNKGLTYTPFYKLPSHDVNNEFYYVVVEDIIVGNVPVKVVNKYPRHDGHGGTLVDTGLALTFLERSVFEAVAREFIKHVDKYTYVGFMGILWPCFNVSGKIKDFPSLMFRFQNGQKVDFPWSSYLIESDIVRDIFCLSFMSHGDDVDDLNGPAIVWGAHHQKNIYMEFDLKRERLGFRRQDCTTKAFLTTHT